MRAQVLAVLRDNKENRVSLVKACFDAMRKHKETSKLDTKFFLLNEVERPNIEELKDYIGRS